MRKVSAIIRSVALVAHGESKTIDITQWANGTDDTGPVEIQDTGVIPADGLVDTAIEWEVEHIYANGVRMIHNNKGSSINYSDCLDLSAKIVYFNLLLGNK
jgi:butyrate kinase